VDLLVDGTDNVQARYLINDLCVKHNLPWIYGGCVGVEGRVLALRPPRTACLRCLFPTAPAADQLPTCDTAGVLGSAAAVVGSLQALAAIKILAGHSQAAGEGLLAIDFWANRFHSITGASTKRNDCPCCGGRQFPFLDNQTDGSAVALCGRDAVQIRPPKRNEGHVPLDLPDMADRLAPLGSVERTPYLLRCKLHDPAGISVTLFADGRAIVHGTSDLGRAKSVYARFIGL
jgi:adenylyltransferase/sulfurtransferase